jgi:hypothetical protein
MLTGSGPFFTECPKVFWLRNGTALVALIADKSRRLAILELNLWQFGLREGLLQ